MKKWMNVCAWGLGFLLTAATPGFARDMASTVTELDRLPPLPGDFPVPHDPGQLFYLQRSMNSNTVVYAANLDPGGTIDPQNPLNVFWRRYNNEGERRPLNFFERVLAFGARIAEAHAGEYDAYVAGYPERKFTVEMDKSGTPIAVVRMGEHLARLMAVYVKMEGSAFIPTIISADIFGIDEASGKVLQEHLVPR
jgi:hypothetical protein